MEHVLSERLWALLMTYIIRLIRSCWTCENTTDFKLHIADDSYKILFSDCKIVLWYYAPLTYTEWEFCERRILPSVHVHMIKYNLRSPMGWIPQILHFQSFNSLLCCDVGLGFVLFFLISQQSCLPELMFYLYNAFLHSISQLCNAFSLSVVCQLNQNIRDLSLTRNIPLTKHKHV